MHQFFNPRALIRAVSPLIAHPYMQLDLVQQVAVAMSGLEASCLSATSLPHQQLTMAQNAQRAMEPQDSAQHAPTEIRVGLLLVTAPG